MPQVLNFDFRKSLTNTVDSKALLTGSGTPTLTSSGVVLNNSTLKTSYNFSYPSVFSLGLIVTPTSSIGNTDFNNGPFLVIGPGGNAPEMEFGLDMTKRTIWIHDQSYFSQYSVPTSIDLTKKLYIYISYNSGSTIMMINDITIITFNHSLSAFTYNTPLYIGGFVNYPYDASGCKWGGLLGTYEELMLYNTVIDNMEMFKNSRNHFLIQDGDDICTTDGTSLIKTYVPPYTIDMFYNSGIVDITKINPNIISKINNSKFKISVLKIN